MSRKPKEQKKDANGNKIPNDTLAVIRLETLTRENIQYWLYELHRAYTKLEEVNVRVELLRKYNVPEEEIAIQRKLMEDGVSGRIEKFESYIRQTAMLMLRAKGCKHWINEVKANINMVKTVEEKKAKTLATL